MTFVATFIRNRLAVRALRDGAPEPPAALVARTLGLIEARARRRETRVRRGAAVVLTGAMLAALGAAGGAGYAANAARDLGDTVREAVVAPARADEPVRVFGINAGGDQYRPGYGFGDPNHNHTGPPGIQRAGGGAAPPPRARRARDGRAALVDVSVAFSEQCSLFLSVHDADDRPLLLTQESRRGGTRIGTRVSGPQTKFIRYTLLVPRAVAMQLRIPLNLLRPGSRYEIRIVGFDVDGNRTETRIPFLA